MTDQELQEEAGILDKACRQCGAELAQGGLSVLSAHVVAVNAMVAKFKRLEAVKANQMASLQADTNGKLLPFTTEPE